jgi:hypothetical protein
MKQLIELIATSINLYDNAPLVGCAILAYAGTMNSHEQNKDSDTYANNFPIVTALLEIQEGKINPKEYLAKIKFPQPRNTVDRGAQYK